MGATSEQLDARLARMFYVVRAIAFVSEASTWLFDVLFYRSREPWRVRFGRQTYSMWYNFRQGLLRGAQESGVLNDVQLRIWRLEAKHPELKSWRNP